MANASADRLTGPGGRRRRAGQRQPAGHPRPGDLGQQRLHLGQTGDRLDREHVRPGGGQHLQPWPVPGPELGDRQPVVTPVLRAVGQRRPVRTDGGGHPAPLRVRRGRPGRGRDLHAAPQQRVRRAPVDTDRGQPVVRELVGRRGRHSGPGGEEAGVRRRHGFGRLEQQPPGPQGAGQVVPGRLQLGRQPAVQQHRPLGQRRCQIDSGHVTGPPTRAPRRGSAVPGRSPAPASSSAGPCPVVDRWRRAPAPTGAAAASR